MKANQTFVSLLVTAALSLPSVVFAAGMQDRVPGTTDEARALAAQLSSQNQSAPAARGYDDVAPIHASSTDEARALAGKRQLKPATLAQPSDCNYAGVLAGSTDEARAAYGRLLVGAADGCTQHAQSTGTTVIQ